MAKSVKKKSAKEASNLFHNIMAASVKGNPKPQNKGVEINETYHLPFDSTFDWRTGLFNELKEVYVQAIIEIVSKYKETDADLEWKDTDGLLNFALDENLHEKINFLFQQKVEKYLTGQ